MNRMETENPLLDRLDALMGEYSMPELVEGLLRLSRRYKAELRDRGNGEDQGWEAWDEALTGALLHGEGPQALDDFEG